MLCYKDRTYCVSSSVCDNETCRLRLPDAELRKAEESGLPVSYADFRSDPDMCVGFVPVRYLQDQAACGFCGGLGTMDSGGITPWGEFIDVPCTMCHGTGRLGKLSDNARFDSLPAYEHGVGGDAETENNDS